MSPFQADAGPEFPIWQLPHVPKGVLDPVKLKKAPTYGRPRPNKRIRPETEVIKVTRPRVKPPVATAEERPGRTSGEIDTSVLDAQPVAHSIRLIVDQAVGPAIKELERHREESTKRLDEVDEWRRRQDKINEKLALGLSKQQEQGAKRDEALLEGNKQIQEVLREMKQHRRKTAELEKGSKRRDDVVDAQLALIQLIASQIKPGSVVIQEGGKEKEKKKKKKKDTRSKKIASESESEGGSSTESDPPVRFDRGGPSGP